MGSIKRQGLKGSIVNYAGVALGAIFFLVIFPNILDKRYLGFYQLFLSITMVFAQIPLLGTANVLYKYYNKWLGTNRIRDFNSFAFLSIIGAGIVFAILFYLLREPIISFYAEKSPLFVQYYFIIPILVLVQALIYYLDYYAMLQNRVTVPTFVREVLTRSLLIIVFCLLSFNLLSEPNFVVLYTLVYFIAFGFLFFYTYKYFNFRFGNPLHFRKENEDLKDQFQYGLSNTGMAFITSLQNFADAIILPMFLGIGALGIYGRPLFLGLMINIPYRSISYAASPAIMEALSNDNLDEVAGLNKKIGINLLLIGLLLFVLVVVNADNFFNLIKPEYRLAENVLYIIAFGRLVDMSFGLNSIIIISSKYYKWIVIFTLIALGLAITLNLTLIPLYGMDGAALATSLSLILFNIFNNFFIYKKFGFHCFSKHYITLAIIGAIAITITLFVPDFVHQGLNNYFGTSIASVAVNIIIKSAVAALLVIVPTLYFRISEDFNSFFKLVISGRIFKGGYKMEEL